MSSTGGRAWLGTFATNAAILGSGIATGILTARLLHPDGRGALAAVVFWPQLLAAVALFSLPEAIIYRISLPGVDRRAVLATGFWLALALGGAAASLSYLLLPVLLGAKYMAWLPLTRAYSIIFIPACFLALSLNAVFQGDLEFGRLNLLRLLVPLTYLAGLGTLWALDWVTVDHILWAALGGTLAGALLSAAMLWRQLGRPSSKEAWGLIRICGSFHLTALIVLAGSQADRFVAIRTLDSASIGAYAVALTVSSSGLAIVTNTFNSVMFPVLVRQDLSEQRAYLGRGLRYSMLITVLGALPLAAACPWLIPFVFGREFQGAVAPAIILAAAYVPLGLRQITVRSLRGLGESGAGTIAEALALGVFAVSVWPLVSTLKLVGIASAFLIANIVSLTYLAVYLRKRLGLGIGEWWGLEQRTVMDLWDRGRAQWAPALRR